MATRPRRGSAASRPISSSLPTADWRLRYLRAVQATHGDAAAAAPGDENGAAAPSAVPPTGVLGIESSPPIQQRRIQEATEAENSSVADSPMIVGSVPQQMAPLALRRLASQRRMMGLPPPAAQPASDERSGPRGAASTSKRRPAHDSIRKQLEAKAKASLAADLFQEEEPDDEDDHDDCDSVSEDRFAGQTGTPPSAVHGLSSPRPYLDASRRSASLGDVLPSPSLPSMSPADGPATPASLASIASSTGSQRLSITDHGPRRHSSGLGVIFGTPSPCATPPAVSTSQQQQQQQPSTLQQAAAMAVREVSEQQSAGFAKHAVQTPTVDTITTRTNVELATTLNRSPLAIHSTVAVVQRGKRGSSGTPRSSTGASHARSDARSDTERASLSPSVGSSPPSSASVLVSTGTRAQHGSTASSSVCHQTRYTHRARHRTPSGTAHGDTSAFPDASVSSAAWPSSTSARIRGLNPHPQAGSALPGGVAKISSSLPSDESPGLAPMMTSLTDADSTNLDPAGARLRRGSASSSDTAGLTSATGGHDPYAALPGAYGAFAVGPSSVESSIHGGVGARHDSHGQPARGMAVAGLPTDSPPQHAIEASSTPVSIRQNPVGGVDNDHVRTRSGRFQSDDGDDDAGYEQGDRFMKSPHGRDQSSLDQIDHEAAQYEHDDDEEEDDDDDDGVQLVFGDAEGLQGTSGAWSSDWQPQQGQDGAVLARGDGRGMAFIPPHELALGTTAPGGLPGRPPHK